MKAKDYDAGLKSSDCLVNSNAYFTWRDPSQGVNWMEETSKLWANNKQKFKDLWGRQEFCWTGWVRHWVWKRPLKNGYFLAFCSVEGTTYEVVLENDFTRVDFEAACKETLDILEEVFEIERI